MKNEFKRDEELEMAIANDDDYALERWIETYKTNVSSELGKHIDYKLFNVFLYGPVIEIADRKNIHEARDLLTSILHNNAYKCLGLVMRCGMSEHALFMPGTTYMVMENGIKKWGGGSTVGLMNAIADLSQAEMAKWFEAAKDEWRNAFMHFHGSDAKDSFGNIYGEFSGGEIGTIRVGLRNIIPVLKCRQSEILLAAYECEMITENDAIWIMEQTKSLLYKARVKSETLNIIRSIEEAKNLKSKYAQIGLKSNTVAL